MSILTTDSCQAAIVALEEYESKLIECDPTTAAALVESKHVKVTPTDSPGRYWIKARHKVGVAHFPGFELRIVPKVSIARLLYMAAFLRNDGDAWDEEEALLGNIDDPLSAVAHALLFHAEAALRPTPLQGYVSHEQAEMRVRGRLLFERQISARAGVLLPAELRFDEYELGIPENRVLKAALLLVSRFVREPQLTSRLRHLLGQLDGVEPWRVGESIPALTFTRLNDRYRKALTLASLVLESRSIEYTHRSVAGTAFMFNMNQVFESYLEASFRELAEMEIGGVVEGQHLTTLDSRNTLKMKPDITWWRNGTCRAVIDAKYKRVTSDDYPNADAYQMLAYCTRFGLARGFLVYADLDGTAPATTVVRNCGVEIVTTSVDLGGSIDRLRRSVREFVSAVAEECSI